MNRYKKYLPRVSSFVALAFFLMALFVIHHQMHAYHVKHIRALVVNMPPLIIAQALLLTVLGYLAVTFYDTLAFYYLEKKVSPAHVLLSAFISFAVTHNVGHSLIAGTGIRYRFYSSWSITGMETIQISLFNSITYALGLVTVLLGAFGMDRLFLRPMQSTAVSYIILFSAVVYVAYAICLTAWRPELLVKGVRFSLPSLRMTLLQTLVGSIDIVLSGLVLYVLLTATLAIPLSEFFITYILALILGLFSQIPGGLGVFEGMFLHLLSARYPGADIMASLVLYRLIYYFLPLIPAGILMLAYEIREQKDTVHAHYEKRARGATSYGDCEK